MSDFSRRRILRGMLNGSAVSVALPFLNCFLNGNGNALASGDPLPVRFGTWGWGLGMNEKIFVPKKTGQGYDLPEEIESLKPIQNHINLFTGFNTFKDSAPLMCHHTGWVILRTGIAPTVDQLRPGETIDVTVAKRIGNTTRRSTTSDLRSWNVRFCIVVSCTFSANNSSSRPSMSVSSDWIASNCVSTM